MEKNNNVNYIPAAEGVLRGFIMTVVLLLIFAVVMTFTEVSSKVSSMFYLITTLISIMYGSIYAVKKIRRRGWLIGIIVAVLYLLILYIVSVISGNSAVLGIDRIKRFSLALLVGLLSGMLGVNI
ncbi:TIGR04086 family membrane protein [Clostridium fermenticellae]|uniref:TIGR04086 family membrane protein n=1 Tax=Clostridium fermenticellae TaxID=2068654 RepID=A0A386H2B6_9CLOT|nr:TIGR04086 family membrane protein [Clostridium fermenticellae]AYD39847.1 TIGR04086 family membrane protein [Clostridium fermenticellae]